MDGTGSGGARPKGPMAAQGWARELPDKMPTLSSPPVNKREWHAAMLMLTHHTVQSLVAAATVEDLDRHKVLLEAVVCGRTVIAQQLIDKGVRVSVVNTKGQTALHIAALRYDEATIEVLLAADIDVNVHDKNGLTARCSLSRAIEDREKKFDKWTQSFRLPQHYNAEHSPPSWSENAYDTDDMGLDSQEEDSPYDEDSGNEDPQEEDSRAPCAVGKAPDPTFSPRSPSSVSAASSDALDPDPRMRTPSEAPPDEAPPQDGRALEMLASVASEQDDQPAVALPQRACAKCRQQKKGPKHCAKVHPPGPPAEPSGNERMQQMEQELERAMEQESEPEPEPEMQESEPEPQPAAPPPRACAKCRRQKKGPKHCAKVHAAPDAEPESESELEPESESELELEPDALPRACDKCRKNKKGRQHCARVHPRPGASKAAPVLISSDSSSDDASASSDAASSAASSDADSSSEDDLPAPEFDPLAWIPVLPDEAGPAAPAASKKPARKRKRVEGGGCSFSDRKHKRK